MSQRVRGAEVIRFSRVSCSLPRDCVKGPDILSSVALALLLTTALAIAGFLATSIQGVLLAARLTEASPVARGLVGQHVLWAIPAGPLALFSQFLVVFYFILTCRLVQDDIACYA